MIKPPRLKKGDTIGLVAPSYPLSEKNKREVQNFKQYIEELGLQIKFANNFTAVDTYGASGGTPQQRAEDLNSMFKDQSVAAIWCLQGGNTANQTLNLLDFELIKNNPKIFIGKSDIDVLSLAIHTITGLITFHGPDAKIGSGYEEMDTPYTKEWFKKRLLGGSKEFVPTTDWISLRKGNAEGRLVGCNLGSILKLAGTKYFPDFKDSILFIETYKLISGVLLAELQQLSLLGVFDEIKGIVVGNNFEYDDGGKNIPAEQLINEFVSTYQFPVMKIGEFGHYQPHAFLPFGAKVVLDATAKTLQLSEDFLANSTE